MPNATSRSVGLPASVYRLATPTNPLHPKMQTMPVFQSAWKPVSRLIQRCATTAAALPELEALPDAVSVSPKLDMTGEDINNFFQVKGSNITKQDQISAAIDAGKIYYGINADTAKKVTKDLINSLWDTQYALLSRTGDLDWSRNCADYATGEVASRTHRGEISPTKEYLANKDHYDSAGSVSEPTKEKLTPVVRGLEVGEYVANGANHFIKLEVRTKGTEIVVSEKDGESAIYTATGGPEKVAEILCVSFQSQCNFYKKK